jgi:hypothetical protein
MRRLTVYLVIAFGLISIGWVAGRAQDRTGDFELTIDAPAGRTRVECVRGCGLIGKRDLANPRAGQMPVYEFSCGSSGRCNAVIAGFQRR